MTRQLVLIPLSISSTVNREDFPDINLHYLKVIKHFAVENTRTARRFISGLKLGIEINTIQFVEIDSQSPENFWPVCDNWFKKGHSVGLMSEAGCPGVADPGQLLVKLAHQSGIKVIPLVGPSSILLALMASGFNGQHFAFSGYLPIEKTLRVSAIRKAEIESKKKSQTQIWIETPYRNESLFQDMLNYCHPDTMLCVARGLNSPEEFIKSFSIKQWKEIKIDWPKIPCVFLIYAN